MIVSDKKYKMVLSDRSGKRGGGHSFEVLCDIRYNVCQVGELNLVILAGLIGRLLATMLVLTMFY